MPRELVIDGVRVADDTDCYVVAEVGHNHQGKLETAKEMIRVAHECGASAVKLQKRNNRQLYTRVMYDKPYDNENSFGPTYGLHRDALEFDRAGYSELRDYATSLGVTFFATPFDFASVDFLAALDLPAYKLASGDLRNTPLLQHVARLGKPMILSTGAATMEDVRRAYDAIMPINAQLCILQCTAGYPATFEELDLRVIETYRTAFPDVVVGLSAHDNGIAMSVASYVLGARVIEKHFTLNRALKGTDHAFSLEPVGLRKMVRDLRRTRMALGDGCKKTYVSEEGAYVKMGKALVAARDLPPGHSLERGDIAIKSPGVGLPPYELEQFIGKVLVQGITEDTPLNLAMVGVSRSGEVADRLSLVKERSRGGATG
jgi:N-acetylneuraminate synthase/sialic acid synthase